jgi:hypothetical protein
MLLHTSNGPRYIREEDVIFIYRDRAMGQWCAATLVLDNGKQVSGLALVAALDALEAKLAWRLEKWVCSLVKSRRGISGDNFGEFILVGSYRNWVIAGQPFRSHRRRGNRVLGEEWSMTKPTRLEQCIFEKIEARIANNLLPSEAT